MNSQLQQGPVLRSIGYIAKSAMNRLDNYDLGNFERMVNIILEEYSNFRLYSTNEVKVKYIKLSDSLMGKLPPDFVQYTKVGFKIGGKVYTLSINRDLAKPRPECCFDTIDGITGNTNEALGAVGAQYKNGYYFADHYYGTEYVTGMYGISGGTNISYFDIDEAKKLIWLTSPIPADELIVEYISNGIDDSAETLVPHYCVEPLRLYVIWQMSEYSDTVNLTDKRRREHQFGRALENMRIFNTIPTMTEYLDSCYAKYQQGPKR